jgi:hypothetical protein
LGSLGALRLGLVLHFTCIVRGVRRGGRRRRERREVWAWPLHRIKERESLWVFAEA